MAVGFGSQSSKFEDAQENEATSFLPGDAESVKALKAIERFPDGQVAPAVTVIARDGGLTPEDTAKAQQLVESLKSDPPPITKGTQGPIPSRDGAAALVVTQVEDTGGTGEDFLDSVKEIRRRAHALEGGGLQVEVTGAAGFGADAIEVFGDINGQLLAAAGGLVLILLILIYRSPIFWTIPFFTVLFAESTARGIGYLLSEAGVVINGQSGGILPVLVFGAGTDYALLLVARYREELRRHDSRHEAMDLALRTAGPAIFFSGIDGDGGAARPDPRRGQRHRRSRPDRRDGHLRRDDVHAHDAAGGAAGRRPADLLAVRAGRAGRAAAAAHERVAPGDLLGAGRRHRRRDRVRGRRRGRGNRVRGGRAAQLLRARAAVPPARPELVLSADRAAAGGPPPAQRRDARLLAARGRPRCRHPSARRGRSRRCVLVVLCAGLLELDTGLTSGNSFRGEVEAVRGSELLAAHFPAGANVPTTVVIPDRADVEPVRAALEGDPAVAAVGEPVEGPPGVKVDVQLKVDPYSIEAFDQIPQPATNGQARGRRRGAGRRPDRGRVRPAAVGARDN